MSPSWLLESQPEPTIKGISADDGNQDTLEALAIIGFALEYPQDANTPEGFWKVLEEKRNVMTEWPPDRINLDAFFYRDDGQRKQKQVAGAHFLTEDLGAFDASFFNISATEAVAMDIQQRKLLEITYHAFENAGIRMDTFCGSKTGVYSGSMSDDYLQILAKDIDYMPKHSASGYAKAMVANRISWFYDFHGPSICMDSACSSSLMAFDFACQGLRNRDCNMAVVTGSSLSLAPEGALSLINMGFLSPRGKCHSFDDRADGYSRGEGFGVVILKRVSDAIRDGDAIRAVVRSSGSNQDGHTKGITQPSRDMQAALIRETYAKAGLDLAATRFFEAHGTGTPLGDPIEASAIGSVFRTVRSQEEPLYVGALKSNVGHLEGGSGIAAVIKTVMVLEKGIIPPNANFERLNPRIDADFLNLKFPTQITPWPCCGLRRASIASFGFGGSNSHVVLDDAYNYLSSRRLEGKEFTVRTPPNYRRIRKDNADQSRSNWDDFDMPCNGSFAHTSDGQLESGCSDANQKLQMIESRQDKLLVLSAADERGIQRLAKAYELHFQKLGHLVDNGKNLDNLCYTLSARRSSLPWKSYAVVNSFHSLKILGSVLSKPVTSIHNTKIAMVFTGQGAQYKNMGRTLMAYPAFRATIEQIDDELQHLGCMWSVFDVLEREDSSSSIDDPEMSQASTTALQMALYDLLQVLGVQASLTVGHSSGEIAAAYASGALSLKSACKVSYFRGKHASSLKHLRASNPGAMMSVDLPETQMRKAIQQFVADHPSRSTPYIACVNSPSNVTISGDEGSIEAQKITLGAEQVRVRKLNTGVAYHSPHMEAIAQQYAKDLTHLETGANIKGIKPPIMISSVQGEYIRDLHEVCKSDYWVRNLLSPVQFSKAMSVVSSEMNKKRTRKLGEPKLDFQHIVEVGPHSALRRSILECLEYHGIPHPHSRYQSALSRGSHSIRCILTLVGELYSRGYPVDVQKANEIGHGAPVDARLLTDLPSYPFNHSKTYWHESSISSNARLRNGVAIHELLGVPVPDWNPLEPRWRKFFDLSEMPWIGHHKVNGRIIYPAAGMVSMALQAAEQVADGDKRIVAYQIRDAIFTAPITIQKADKSEVQLHMRLSQGRTDDKHTKSLDFGVYSMGETGWFQNCSGNVQILYQQDDEDHSKASTSRQEQSFYQKQYSEALQRSNARIPTENFYGQLRSNGLQYGPAFQPLDDLAWDGGFTAVGTIKCFTWEADHSQHDRQPHIIHPTVLDGAGQLPWVSLTKGAEQVLFNGFAVTRIRHAWIASSGLSYPESSYVNAYCTTTLKGSRGTDSSIFALDAAGNVVLRVSHLETTAVGGDEAASMIPHPRKLCYSICHQPDLFMLDGKSLQNFVSCGVGTASPPESFYRDLELALFYFSTRVLDDIESQKLPTANMKPCVAKYISWLRRQLYSNCGLPQRQSDWITRIDDSNLVKGLLDRLAATNAEGQLIVHVGRNLQSIVQGCTDPSKNIFESGLAATHYGAIFSTTAYFKKLKNYLSALSHKSPWLDVLEVRAGTGLITEHVLQGLDKHFARYDYTDISSQFFEQAREKFSRLERMTYKVLDIERDPAEQGYEPRCYDVVVAAWALHGTRSLANTISNIRKLLRPGGRLIMIEATEPELLRTGFVFGTLPSWWLSIEPEREWSPCLTEARWRELLVENGFQEIELALPDYESNICHGNSILIAKAGHDADLNGTITPSVVPTEFTIVIAPNSAFQSDVASKLHAHIQSERHRSCSTTSIEDPNLVKLIHTVMIILIELDQPFLSHLDPSSFEKLQMILGKVQRVLWATSSTVSSSSFPEVQMILGLARVLFTERPGLSLVTLSFSSPANDRELFVQCISRVFQKTVASGSLNDHDLEYLERDGVLLTKRIMDSDAINQEVFEKTHSTIRRQQLSRSPPLVLSAPRSGLLDSIRWEEDPRYHVDLGADEIEIQVEALGVNFRDLLVILGKYSDTSVGCECAGIVTRTGTNCDVLRPGDRVCAFTIGCSRTHVRCHYQLAVKIPDFLTTAEAASLPCTGVAAYHSLISLAHLSHGESVLIHSATGGTGQMAVQIAHAVGADVFVTVGNEEKRRLIKQLYGVSDDHIFNSRDGAFARDIYLATNGRGVDVVLNSLSKELLLASWECVAPCGRFIELGKTDIEANLRLPMVQFSKNVTFHAVAIDHLSVFKPGVVGRAIQSVLDMIGEGSMRVASPLKLYPISEAESVFRFMQSGQNTGKMVLTFDPSDIVPTWLRAKYTCCLDPNRTYLIAGGLGGLGRSAVRWMAGQGAKYFILLSRSGPRTTAALALIEELNEARIMVRTPRCDVSDSSSLASALATCSDMPPIKGCLQATMVLQDSLFESMAWDQWSISIRSKVNSTWNLHRQLPQGLTFFVMLSSVAGIVGNMGQANYAAGNTFQDGLAAHRLALGEKAVSIDLGWMEDVGAVAENTALTKGNEYAGELAPVYENEFLALLDHYCDPDLPILTPEQAQPVIGLVTPAQFRTKWMQPPDWLVDRPLFRGLAQEVERQDGGNVTPENKDDRDWLAELLHAPSRVDAANIVVDALVHRLSKATSIPPAEIDRTRPLHAYGVDSLLAVELRNWFSKLFKADVAIFEITGQASLEKVAEGAAASSSLLKNMEG